MTVNEQIERKRGNTFHCPVWTFDRYQMRMDEEGLKYIVGCGEHESELSLTKVSPEEMNADFFTSISGEKATGQFRKWIEENAHRDRQAQGSLVDKQFNDNGLLVDAIKMGEKLYKKDGILLLIDMKQYEQTYPQLEEDVREMMRWCQRHGLLYDDAKLWINYHRIGIRVGALRKFFSELYYMYLLYLRIYRGDVHHEESKRRFEKTELSACKKKLYQMLEGHEILVGTDFSKDLPRLYFRCETLADVIYAQLRFQCTENENGDILSVCELCGAPYMKHRINHLQCTDCQEHAPHRSMARKREARRNAKKAGQQ